MIIHVLFLTEVYKQFSMKFGHLILRKIIKMSEVKAKMHQNRFRLGLPPGPAGGAYSAGFNGPSSKGRKGELPSLHNINGL